MQQIPIDALHPFTNHPFKVLDDEAMTRTVESIAQYGVLAPLIARPRPEGGYEIISGHRRQYAAKLAGLDTLPVIVRQISDDAAVILMVDSNLQREHILPSERAFAYKMKLDAIKNQGARSDLTSTQVAQKLSVEKVGDDAGVSKDTIRRFIRLTNLVPELLDMVDEKKISFNPAVELSYLDESQQRAFLEAMDGTQNAPSVSQAQQLKKMAQCGEFTYEKAFDILGQEKKSEQDTVTIKNDILRKYFFRVSFLITTLSSSSFLASPIMATTVSVIKVPSCASFLMRFACETDGKFWVSSIARITSCCCSGER